LRGTATSQPADRSRRVRISRWMRPTPASSNAQ
jgi:hypothetical protein